MLGAAIVALIAGTLPRASKWYPQAAHPVDRAECYSARLTLSRAGKAGRSLSKSAGSRSQCVRKSARTVTCGDAKVAVTRATTRETSRTSSGEVGRNGTYSFSIRPMPSSTTSARCGWSTRARAITTPARVRTARSRSSGARSSAISSANTRRSVCSSETATSSHSSRWARCCRVHCQRSASQLITPPKPAPRTAPPTAPQKAIHPAAKVVSTSTRRAVLCAGSPSRTCRHPSFLRARENP